MSSAPHVTDRASASRSAGLCRTGANRPAYLPFRGGAIPRVEVLADCPVQAVSDRLVTP